MTLIDQSVDLVRLAVKRIGKKPLADRAGVSDAILSRVDDRDFSPTVRTQRKLEQAAAKVVAETADAAR